MFFYLNVLRLVFFRINVLLLVVFLAVFPKTVSPDFSSELKYVMLLFLSQKGICSGPHYENHRAYAPGICHLQILLKENRETHAKYDSDHHERQPLQLSLRPCPHHQPALYALTSLFSKRQNEYIPFELHPINDSRE